MESFLTSHMVMSRLSSDRIARDNSSSPSSGEETQKIEDFGEADISSQVRRVMSSEFQKSFEIFAEPNKW